MKISLYRLFTFELTIRRKLHDRKNAVVISRILIVQKMYRCVYMYIHTQEYIIIFELHVDSSKKIDINILYGKYL